MLEVLVLLRMTNHKYSINTEKSGFLMYEIKKKKRNQRSTQHTGNNNIISSDQA